MSKKEKLSTALLRLYLSDEIFSLSVNQTLASQFIFLDSRNNNLRQNRMNFFGLEQGLPYSRLSMKEYSCS